MRWLSTLPARRASRCCSNKTRSWATAGRRARGFAVYRDDEAGADLAERLRSAIWSGCGRCRGASRWPRRNSRPSSERAAQPGRLARESCTGFECETLLDWLQRRGAQIKGRVGAYTGAEADFFHRRMMARGTMEGAAGSIDGAIGENGGGNIWILRCTGSAVGKTGDGARLIELGGWSRA